MRYVTLGERNTAIFERVELKRRANEYVDNRELKDEFFVLVFTQKTFRKIVFCLAGFGELQ